MDEIETNEATPGTPGAPGDPFAVLHRRRRGVWVTTAAAVALGLAVTGGAVAGATGSSTTSTTAPSSGSGHPDGPGGHGFDGTPPAAFGTVKSVGSNTFTLTGRDGATVTVDVSSSTTYVDPSVTSPTFSTLKVGDHVAVFGTDASDTVTATKVAVGGPWRTGGPGHAFDGTPPAAFGTVKSVGSNTFTLTGRDGATVTVDVSSSTTYVDPSVTSPTFSTLKVGDHVAVFGTDTSDTVTATKVAIGGASGPGGMGGAVGPGFGGKPPAAFGTVKTVGSNTFTLTGRDGTTVTVDVSSSTTYREFGKTSASFADVTVGTQVVVFGTDTSNTVTATSVGIGGPGDGSSGAPHMGGPGGYPAGSGSTTGSTSSEWGSSSIS